MKLFQNAYQRKTTLTTIRKRGHYYLHSAIKESFVFLLLIDVFIITSFFLLSVFVLHTIHVNEDATIGTN